MAISQIQGLVDRDGRVISGEGFRCDRIQEGTYIVHLERPFAGLPVPVCTVYGPPWVTFNMSVAVVEAQPNMFVCLTSTPDRPVDCGFTFIVSGES